MLGEEGREYEGKKGVTNSSALGTEEAGMPATRADLRLVTSPPLSANSIIQIRVEDGK